jgi:hypothetical protein
MNREHDRGVFEISVPVDIKNVTFIGTIHNVFVDLVLRQQIRCEQQKSEDGHTRHCFPAVHVQFLIKSIVAGALQAL